MCFIGLGLAVVIGATPYQPVLAEEAALIALETQDGSVVYIEGTGNLDDEFSYIFSYRDEAGELKLQHVPRTLVIVHEWDREDAVVKRFEDGADGATTFGLNGIGPDMFELYVPQGSVKDRARITG